MAFAGMFIGLIFLVIFVLLIIAAIAFGITAIVLKIVGKVKDNRKIKTTGNVFLTLSIISITPIVLFTGYLKFNSTFAPIHLPNGGLRYASCKTSFGMIDLAYDGSDEAIAEIEKLLDKNPNLVYFHDNNRMSILDVGLKNGNAKLVRTAIEHGAVIDCPERYEHIIYETSMEEYFINMMERDFTRDDIEIITLLFENGADTSCKFRNKVDHYSNPFGMAIWSVLYNDSVVTDDELEFIQVIIDNGITHDNELVLREELCTYDDNPHYVKKDNNYYLLMEIIEGN